LKSARNANQTVSSIMTETMVKQHPWLSRHHDIITDTSVVWTQTWLITVILMA